MLWIISNLKWCIHLTFYIYWLIESTSIVWWWLRNQVTRVLSDVNVGKLEECSRTKLPFRRVCLSRHDHFTHETGCVAYHPTPVGDRLFSHIHRVFHTICPEWPACHPQGGGCQATRPISRVKWLWRHRQTRRNSNVVRLDSSNFPTFTSEKYLFGTYRRKIINIYCPRHGLS